MAGTTLPPQEAAVQEPPPPAQKSGAGKFIAGIALSLLSAVMLYVMWDGHGNLWPLVFIGFVPMYIAQYRLLPRKWSGLALGIAAGGYWLSMAMMGGAVLGIAVVIAIAVVIGLIWFVIGIFERPFTERTSYKWFLVQLPLLWVGFEVIFQSNLILGSNYWIAYRAAAVPSMIQPVSVVSTPALSFLILIINAAIALAVLKWMDGRWPALAGAAGSIPAKTVKWSSAIAATLAVFWVLWSLLIYSQVNAALGKTVKVASVQSGTENTTSSEGNLASSWVQNSPEDNARNVKLQAQLTRMTRDAASQGAQLIVWPEEALDYDVASSPNAAWVGELAKETNATIVGGFMPDSPNDTSPNNAAVWLPTGELAGDPFSKVHPVIAENEAFTPGTQAPVYRTPIGQLGVVICFDHDFPDGAIRIEAASGAQIMAVPAIDPTSIVNLRWQSLTFRAVENRIPMVKTDIGYDSAIINANGNLVERLAIDAPEGAERLLVADVNLGPRGAPFSYTGGYAFATLIVLGLGLRYVRQLYLYRRSRKVTTDA